LSNSIRNNKRYKHLSIEEREIISMELAKRTKLTKIAELLGRHKSTISREISKYKNNSKYQIKYFPSKANKRAKDRKKYSHCIQRIPNEQIREYLEEKLKLGWSPEQIAGRLPLDHPELKTNYETIYQYIYTDRRDLIIYLPKKHVKRRKRSLKNKTRKSIIPNRVFIDKRPDTINNREEVGHWEADLAISKNSKSVIQILYERKTRLVEITKLPDKTSKRSKNAIIRKMRKMPKELVKSITYDNGTENAKHEKVNETLDIDSYFCNPYHSWEKGGVENSIGLIRRYLPKKTDFAKISDYFLKQIQNLINNRPRKCIGYRTPNEMLKRYKCCT